MDDLDQQLRDAARKGDLEEVTRLRDQGARIDGADEVNYSCTTYLM